MRGAGRRGWVGGAVAAAVLAGCGGATTGPDLRPAPPLTSPTSTGAADLTSADLWLSFEEETLGYDGSTAYPDAAGGPSVGRVVVANGGAVRRARGAGGSSFSIVFPALCRAVRGCPRGLVEVPPTRALDPGTADFEYGAAVWLAPDRATADSNVVQKGRFGSGGGQWKLQVDSEAGFPSCLVRSGDEVLVVRSDTSVADSRWHRVVCRRDGQGLEIAVDGSVVRHAARTGSVTNDEPLRIGSPGLGDDDDQFHGRVDDVYLRIDR